MGVDARLFYTSGCRSTSTGETNPPLTPRMTNTLSPLSSLRCWPRLSWPTLTHSLARSTASAHPPVAHPVHGIMTVAAHWRLISVPHHVAMMGEHVSPVSMARVSN